MSRRAPDALFLTEGEIAVRLGMTAAEWIAAAQTLERAGLPLPDPVFKNRRWWPAVKDFLDRRARARQTAPPTAAFDGEEHWDEDRRGRKTRARA